MHCGRHVNAVLSKERSQKESKNAKKEAKKAGKVKRQRDIYRDLRHTKPKPMENGWKSGQIKNIDCKNSSCNPMRKHLGGPRKVGTTFRPRVLPLRNVVAFFRTDARIARKETFGIWSGSSTMDGWSGFSSFFGCSVISSLDLNG